MTQQQNSRKMQSKNMSLTEEEVMTEPKDTQFQKMKDNFIDQVKLDLNSANSEMINSTPVNRFTSHNNFRNKEENSKINDTITEGSDFDQSGSRSTQKRGFLPAITNSKQKCHNPQRRGSKMMQNQWITTNEYMNKSIKSENKV